MFLYIDAELNFLPAYQRVLEYEQGKFIFINQDSHPNKAGLKSAEAGFDILEPERIFSDLYRFADKSYCLLC